MRATHVFFLINALMLLESAFGDAGVGIFKNACDALEAISEDNAARYRQDAIERGLQGKEIEEHVQRRTRNRYLGQKVSDSLDELSLAELFANSPVFKGIAESDAFTKEHLQILKEIMQEVAGEMGGKWMPGEQTVRERAPLVFAIMEKHSPQNIVQMRRFESLVAMKSLMAIERHAISQHVSELPHDKTISEQTGRALTKAHLSGGLKTVNRAIDVGHRDMVNVYLRVLEDGGGRGAAKAKKDRDSDVARLTGKLLESEAVPQEVKDEISRQQDFMSKVKLKSSLSFSEFIITASEYFSVY